MQGQLFTQDFLLRGIDTTPPWQALDEAALDRFAAALQAVFASLHAGSAINEAQTEQLVIEPVLAELGWGDDWLRQVNLSGKRREDVPDLLLFAGAQAKALALAEAKDDRRSRHGLAILEAKRWLRALDRGDPAEAQDPDAPSSQMLRYLSRVDVAADRAVKWGILTNGAVWRLYWQDARSRAEEFFEIDLAAALGVPGVQPALDDPEPRRALKLFFLFFNRAAFLSQGWDSANRSFHAYARGESRLYEERVSKDLGERVFAEVFPLLAQALARGDVQARKLGFGSGRLKRERLTPDYLDELREATLMLLYRLLFLFYAEDRLLLPARDERYRPYSVRALRERVRDDLDAGKALSSRLDHIWRDLQGVFLLIDEGDDAVGMPAYNGGLFDRSRAPLLERSRVPDAVMAPIIDALSRRSEAQRKLWINYRDLSVSHLGGIYERLLEYTLVHEVQAADGWDRVEVDRIAAVPASFARKVSGSYYTHDGLVRLLLRESVGRLCDEIVRDFESQIDKWKGRASLSTPLWNKLDGDPDAGQRDAIDPATRMLELTVCDPAMGSGHFLVTLVDTLADRVLEAASQASLVVNAQPWAAYLAERGSPWVSPVIRRIAHIRRTIRQAAAEHHWTVTDAQLDDRQIVRRMILKKSIYGVDKNPMAVELAKTALWLHTFTVGAPLSFLDHHLKCGDSLHGERLPAVQQELQGLGMLFQQGELDRLALAAANLARVADLTDVDIAEARLSRELAREAGEQVAPLHALLDFWRALRWLLPGWPAADARRLARLGDASMQAALAELMSDRHQLVTVLAEGRVGGEGPGVEAANALLGRVRALAAGEAFFHWWTAFPTVFAADGSGGFDVVVGNPPWDRIKLQQVEWFAEREPRIATQARAADRRRLIAELEKKRAPLWQQYQAAAERTEANARVLAKAGDYPLLGGGDVNLYSLFVERAMSLVQPQGIVALLTPSGIAADKGAAEFFRGIATTGRLGALFDFENKRIFFADVDSRFKFTALVFAGAERRFERSRCAFYLHAVAEIDEPGRTLGLDAVDFALVNPNTGAAPVFRHARDADITLDLYRRHPVLVRHGGVAGTPEVRAWPLRYVRVFDMTNDSASFLTRAELQQRGFTRERNGSWRLAQAVAVPLYVGRMIHQYDHRHAGVAVNEGNLHNPATGARLDASGKADPWALPEPQYWVLQEHVPRECRREWALAFRDIARATDMRTCIAAIVPGSAAGNTLPLLTPCDGSADFPRWAPLLLANLNPLALDYVARQKAQSTHLNWYILEQLPVIAPEQFEASIGGVCIADFVREQVLRLSYTAHDLAPFARDLGHVDAQGRVLPPFRWDDDDRRRRIAALDGLFLHLYGLGDDDAAYLLDSFPIVREQDLAACGRLRTRDDVLAALQRVRAGRLAP
ncbi:MAG: Eco57I restriction-modification methylase domain-containing protein [Proteobacteria bacterium]|nr:Eco57I restriction-modification methylase domain-containing protein [Pseudomonadota bacterium]